MSKTNYSGLDYSGLGSMVNRNPDTGIRYGIIQANRVNSDALGDIYSHGVDVDFENFRDEVKRSLLQAITEIQEVPTQAVSADEVKDILRSTLQDFLFSSRLERAVEAVYDELDKETDVSDLADKAYDAIADDLGDCYPGSDGCTCMDYDQDGYKIHIDSSGDLWVYESPYFTYAQFCSPCAPGACYLSNPLEGQPEANMCYCLGSDWFDKEHAKCPYPIYSVETGEEI